MSKKAPTLADGLMRELLRMRSNTNTMPQRIAQARKFVLDDAMSSFMADLAYASLLTCGTLDKASALLDSMRVMSRLPHPMTWIEYNMRLKCERASREFGATMDISEGQLADTNGWLLLQHPELTTAFMAIECSSHTWVGDGMPGAAHPNHCFMAWAWRVDDGPVPWEHLEIPLPKFRNKSGETIGTTVAGLLTGVIGYQTPAVAVVPNPFLPRDMVIAAARRIGAMTLKEMGSDLRYLWALLATINTLPVTTREVKQDKGYVARGRYRKFVDHSVITLTVPVKRYRRLAAQAMAKSRRRAGLVRAHLRRDWRHPFSPLCGLSHEFVMTCHLCGGRRFPVKEHVRGDASLGWVTHDYAVTRNQDFDKPR